VTRRGRTWWCRLRPWTRVLGLVTVFMSTFEIAMAIKDNRNGGFAFVWTAATGWAWWSFAGRLSRDLGHRARTPTDKEQQ
jgi:hypothetical protein